MNLNKQVCSKESGKKLAELGVTRESLWEWNYKNDANPHMKPKVIRAGSQDDNAWAHVCPAYTVAELLEITKNLRPSVHMYGSQWRCHLMVGIRIAEGFGVNPAEAISHALLSAIDGKFPMFITVEQINEVN